jgi:hypothetical protein
MISVNETDLLKRKAKVLESLDKVRTGHLTQLVYERQHGAKPPVEAFMSEEQLAEYYRRAEQQIHHINGQLKNIELDKQLTKMCEIKDDLQLLIEMVAQADTSAALSSSYNPHNQRLAELARELTKEYEFFDYWGDQNESSSS